jgi:dTDP-3,4-didehydro-2,6-dideoxy-alpha-D-glucose 3-reductase
MSLLNVVVWGLGNHAKNRILPTLAAIDGVDLLGVCSRNGDAVAESAKQWGCYGWSSPEEMLSHPDLDIVYIATPIGLHFRMAEQALKAGKHVWCEKPLTCDYRETQNLIAVAEENSKVLTESFMYLHHPQFKRVKQFVDESRKVNSIICRFGIPDLAVPGFRNDPKLCGGALWDVASYTTSALLALFPEQQVEVLFSEVVQNVDSSVDREGRTVLRFSNGVTAYLEWAIGVAYKNEIDLWSTDGSLFTNKIFSKKAGYQPKYYLRDPNGNMHIEQGEECEQFTEMFHHFVEMMDDEDKIALEREAILRRAKLLDDIVTF